MANNNKILEYHQLSMEILSISNKPVPRVDYFHSILQKIKKFSCCNNIELLFGEKSGFFVYKINDSNTFTKSIIAPDHKNLLAKLNKNSFLDLMFQKLLKNKIDLSIPFFSHKGSFWYSGLDTTIKDIKKFKGNLYKQEKIDLQFESLALIPIFFEKNVNGILQLTSNNKNYLDSSKINLFEGIAHTLSIAIINKRVQGALRERVKELTCLYDISKLAENEKLDLQDMLKQI